MEPVVGTASRALVSCSAIVFIASVGTMVLELTASRLIAAYLGNSLYTWTSVIGVVLAGISIGNYLGGWLADRHAPAKILPWLFLAAGISTFSVLLLNHIAAGSARPAGFHWPAWVMLIVAGVLLLPALWLGTISPVTASLALQRTERTGATVGSMYAWGALGSIVGTFLAGFWLIGEFGSRQVVCLTAAALVVMAAIVASGQKLFRTVALVGILPFIAHYGLIASTSGAQISALARAVAGVRSGWSTRPVDFAQDQHELEAAAEREDAAAEAAVRARLDWREARKVSEEAWAQWGDLLGKQLHALGVTLALRRDDPLQYHDESDYFSIHVTTSRAGDEVVKSLTLDHLIHSYYNPRFPVRLHYEYERIYAAVTERAALLWERRTRVESAVPLDEELVSQFPVTVEYDAATRGLSVRGTMDLNQFRRLLALGADGEYREALFAAWEQASGDWNAAPSRIGGAIVIPLAALPRDVAIPPALATRVRYDRSLKSIVCTAPFSFEEFLGLIVQGAEAAYVDAVRQLYFQSRTTSALFIGGGGFIFPRWIEATFPSEPRIDVSEIDPAVQLAAERELGLPTEYGSPAFGKTYVRTHIGDARQFVVDRSRDNDKRAAAGEPPRTYDFIYGDAFNDLSVPWHLTTREFTTRIRDLLTPREGVYLVNLIDIYPRVEYPPADPAPAETRPLLTSELPPALQPDRTVYGEWQPASGMYRNLQSYRFGERGYLLGYRGVMPLELRDRLLEQVGLNAELQGAVLDLYQRSQQQLAGQFLGRYLNTARSVFPYVYLFTSHEDAPQAARDTFVVVCSLKNLDFEAAPIQSDFWKSGPFAWTAPNAQVEPEDFGEMPAILQLARGQILTDDFAPVDNLLLPVAAVPSLRAEAER